MAICRLVELKEKENEPKLKMTAYNSTVKFEYSGWGVIKIRVNNLKVDEPIMCHGEEILKVIDRLDITIYEKEDLKNLYHWFVGNAYKISEFYYYIGTKVLEEYMVELVGRSHIILSPTSQVAISKDFDIVFFNMLIPKKCICGARYEYGEVGIVKFENGKVIRKYSPTESISEKLEEIYNWIEGNSLELKWIKAKGVFAVFIDANTVEEFERKLEEVVKDIEIKEKLKKLKNRVLELEEEVKKLKEENEKLKNKLEDVRREKDIEINKIKKDIIDKIIENIWKKYYTGIFKKVGCMEFKIKSYKQLKKAMEIMLKELEE